MLLRKQVQYIGVHKGDSLRGETFFFLILLFKNLIYDYDYDWSTF